MAFIGHVGIGRKGVFLQRFQYISTFFLAGTWLLLVVQFRKWPVSSREIVIYKNIHQEIVRKYLSQGTAWVTVNRQLRIPAVCKLGTKPQIISTKINFIYCSKRISSFALRLSRQIGVCFDPKVSCLI